MIRLDVNTKDNSYPIYIGADFFSDLKKMLLDNNINKRIFIITDDNVRDYYLNMTIKVLEDFEVYTYVVKPGENSKSFETANKIYKRLLELSCDRDTTIVALGGGVVGDLSGYVASTYMRGLNFVQIPTTLLSQVDSSVGGKVAINFEGYKNIIGSFYQPKAVIIDVNMLETLESREFSSGMGEVIKYGIIRDYKFLKWIGDNLDNIYNLDKELVISMIKNCLAIKSQIVEEDEKEKNIRKILNFGHTIGHGIESLGEFKCFNHGEAISLGMIYESYIARELGLIDPDYHNKIYSIVTKIIKLKKFNDEEITYIMESLKYDKKSKNGKPVFILPIDRGNVDIFDNIDEKLILKSLKDGYKI
ncbi:3-dehydroquinate synthase [Dethiothermospora halolimnae]|uniref:3-dehydroquinate synthase n=1 Tax=Dethiothermospora halolimnae TaxID=3114390 RepID=UPI003CCBB989